MIPIKYETEKTVFGDEIVKAIVIIHNTKDPVGYSRKVMYGKTEEEARTRMLTWLGDMYEFSPESFVVLPPPVETPEQKLWTGIKNALAITILFMIIMAGLAYLGILVERLTSVK